MATPSIPVALGREMQQSPKPAGGIQRQEKKQRDHKAASYLYHNLSR